MKCVAFAFLLFFVLVHTGMFVQAQNAASINFKDDNQKKYLKNSLMMMPTQLVFLELNLQYLRMPAHKRIGWGGTLAYRPSTWRKDAIRDPSEEDIILRYTEFTYIKHQLSALTVGPSLFISLGKLAATSNPREYLRAEAFYRHWWYNSDMVPVDTYLLPDGYGYSPNDYYGPAKVRWHILGFRFSYGIKFSPINVGNHQLSQSLEIGASGRIKWMNFYTRSETYANHTYSGNYECKTIREVWPVFPHVRYSIGIGW